MKKILPYILLVLIFVNLFAPLSVGINDTTITFNKNVAQAADCKFVYAKFNPGGAQPQPKPAVLALEVSTENCVGQRIFVQIIEVDDGLSGDDPVYNRPAQNITTPNFSINFIPGEKECGNDDCRIKFKLDLVSQVTGTSSAYVNADTYTTFATYKSGPTEGITYTCDKPKDCTDSEWQEQGASGVAQTQQQAFTQDEKQKAYVTALSFAKLACDEAAKNPSDAEKQKKCTEANEAVKKAQAEYEAAQVNKTSGGSALDGLPSCGIFGSSSIMGCVVKFTYYVLFVPTSYLFALSGMFFDSTFAFSVQDTSYRSAFVTQGWSLVRDICNMFFIFILLYIAFSTILNVHGFKTKEMVINVVIIGIMINFSLFAAQLIVDSSNILARVFYNSDAIKVDIIKNGNDGMEMGGIGLYDTGDDKEISLSAAVVGKINPAVIITEANKTNIIGKEGSETTDIGTGTWFLVTILAIAINIVGIIVFLSVGLMFVSRVIGIWVYMILAPLAFFSYTVPKMQGMKTIGWKHWWPQLLSMAFLAPVFIFFMYLIIKFLETGLGLLQNDSRTGLAFVIGVVIPFAFIMILLMKAKDIAKTMSGELGQSITGGVAAVGGMALGGAALGAAAIGRNTVGSFMKGASTGESANQRFARGESRNNWDKFKGAVAHYGTFGGLTKAQQVVGKKINKDQTRVEGYAHARHELDQAASARFHGKKFDELTQPERNTIRERISRDHEGEAQFGKKYNQLTATQKGAVDTAIAPGLAAKTSHADHYIAEARGKQGLISSVVQSSRNGSYDVRNLSKLVVGEKDRGFNKIVTGVTAAVASGMRGAFKQSNIHYGTAQKDLIKDIGNTITDALKSTKVSVDLSHVGHVEKEGDHGHGGGGHH